MNILYTLNSGQPGGMERHVLNLVAGMVKRGHSVYVWCLEGPIVDWYKNAGAEVSQKEIRFELDPKYILNLSRYLNLKKIDILHAHELKASSNAMIAGFFSNTKVRITHVHTPMSEWKIPNKRKKLYTKVAIFGYSSEVNLFSTYEISLTESRKRIKMEEGISETKIKVIPNGIDVEKFNLDSAQKKLYREEILKKFNIPDNAFVIGNLGRITEEKGTDILIKGFAEFVNHLPQEERLNKYLLIAGGGKLENNMRKLIADLGLGNKIIITGVFDETEILKFYSTFDLFVFPTLAEGFGIVMMEAMASGLVVICSDLEVLGEVGGSCVYMFEAGDYKGIAQKLYDLYFRRENFFSSNEMRTATSNASCEPSRMQASNVSFNLGEAAKKRVSDLFTMDKFINNYENLYISTLEARLCLLKQAGRWAAKENIK